MDTKLPTDKSGTPLRVFPILQPIATTAPKPIAIPPRNWINILFPSLGLLNLNSPAIIELIKAPITIPNTKNTSQLNAESLPVVQKENQPYHPPVIPKP